MLKVSVSSLAWCLSLATKPKSSSSNLPAAAAGSCQKAAGRRTKALHKRQLAAKLGKRPGLSVPSNAIWEKSPKCALPSSSPRTHLKHCISFTRSLLTGKQHSGPKCIREDGSGCHIHKRSKRWLRDPSLWRRLTEALFCGDLDVTPC